MLTHPLKILFALAVPLSIICHLDQGTPTTEMYMGNILMVYVICQTVLFVISMLLYILIVYYLSDLTLLNDDEDVIKEVIRNAGPELKNNINKFVVMVDDLKIESPMITFFRWTFAVTFVLCLISGFMWTIIVMSFAWSARTLIKETFTKNDKHVRLYRIIKDLENE